MANLENIIKNLPALASKSKTLRTAARIPDEILGSGPKLQSVAPEIEDAILSNASKAPSASSDMSLLQKLGILGVAGGGIAATMEDESPAPQGMKPSVVEAEPKPVDEPKEEAPMPLQKAMPTEEPIRGPDKVNLKNIDFSGAMAPDPKLEYNEAVRARNSDINNANLMKSAELMRAGAFKTGVNKDAMDMYDSDIKNAGLRIADFERKKELEKDDPNSAVSKGYKSIMEATMGVKISGNPSANDLTKAAPWIQKAYEAQETRNLKKFEAEENRKARQAVIGSKAEEKDKERTISRFDKLNKAMADEISSSRSTFGKNANTLRQAKSVEAMINHYDPNNVDKRQITEIARAMDAMLSSGNPTISGMKKLIPESAAGDASKIAEYISGIPVGARQGEFVKRLMETVGREKQLAEDMLKDSKRRLSSTYKDLKNKDPEKWNDLMEAHGLSEINEQKSDTSGIHLDPQIQERVDYLKSLPQNKGVSEKDIIDAVIKHAKVNKR
jgi:hypothetical protein